MKHLQIMSFLYLNEIEYTAFTYAILSILYDSTLPPVTGIPEPSVSIPDIKLLRKSKPFVIQFDNFSFVIILFSGATAEGSLPRMRQRHHRITECTLGAYETKIENETYSIQRKYER